MLLKIANTNSHSQLGYLTCYHRNACIFSEQTYLYPCHFNSVLLNVQYNRPRLFSGQTSLPRSSRMSLDILTSPSVLEYIHINEKRMTLLGRESDLARINVGFRSPRHPYTHKTTTRKGN